MIVWTCTDSYNPLTPSWSRVLCCKNKKMSMMCICNMMHAWRSGMCEHAHACTLQLKPKCHAEVIENKQLIQAFIETMALPISWTIHWKPWRLVVVAFLQRTVYCLSQAYLCKIFKVAIPPIHEGVLGKNMKNHMPLLLLPKRPFRPAAFCR